MSMLALESCSSLTFHSNDLANITLWETATQQEVFVKDVVLDFQRTLVTISDQAFKQVRYGAPP